MLKKADAKIVPMAERQATTALDAARRILEADARLKLSDKTDVSQWWEDFTGRDTLILKHGLEIARALLVPDAHLERMQKALREAAARFREYERHYGANRDPENAARNAELADMCECALSKDEA